MWLLGAWGFLELRTGSDTPLDAAYHAVQLFIMEGGGEQPPLPWQLHVARFVAPTMLGYAAVRGLLLLARGQVARWRARLFARGHVVVVGDSSTARAVAAGSRALAAGAIVVSDDGAAPRRHAARATFAGPVTDALAVAQARPDRAGHVVVATGDDARNLEAMAAVQHAMAGARRRPVIHVELGRRALWRELHALAVGADRAGATIEFFNLADRQARALLDGAR